MYVTSSLFFFSSFKGLQKFVFQKSSFLAQKVAFRISSLLYFFSSLSNITFVLSLVKYLSSNKSFKETKISSTTLLYVICFSLSFSFSFSSSCIIGGMIGGIIGF